MKFVIYNKIQGSLSEIDCEPTKELICAIGNFITVSEYDKKNNYPSDVYSGMLLTYDMALEDSKEDKQLAELLNT